MVLQEVTIKVETDVIGGKPHLSISHQGIAHPLGIVQLCTSAIQEALIQIAKMEELKASMKDELEKIAIAQ